MTTEIYRALSVVGAGIMVIGTLVLLDAVLRGLVGRCSARADRYAHRVGTQLPRVL
jgi:hypothetical protein